MARLTDQERRDVALTIAGEIDPAKTDYGTYDSKQEIAAILGVIENRALTRGLNFSEVVKQGKGRQFNAWLSAKDRDIARQNYRNHKRHIEAAIDDYFAGYLASPVPDATHYWAPGTMKARTGKANPKWARAIIDRLQVGPHLFGREKTISVQDLAVARARYNLDTYGQPSSWPVRQPEARRRAAQSMLDAGVLNIGGKLATPGLYRAPAEPFERRSFLDEGAPQFEVLAFGTNDFGEPRKAVKSLEQAVANARARGRTPVAVMPNAGNPRIAKVATALQAAAERLGVETVAPKNWARDRIHPSAAEYRAIADQFDGAVVRGDSFAEGIIGAQETRNPLSFAKRGASSTTVLSAITRIDGQLAAAPAGPRGTLAGLGAFMDQVASPGGRISGEGGTAAGVTNVGFLPDTAPTPQPRPSLGMAELAPHWRGTANVSYAHPERGEWSERMTPQAIAHAEAMALMNAPGGLSITSAHRSKSQNKKAGGAKRSQHLVGNAYDMDLSGLTDDERARRVAQARALGARRLGSYDRFPDMLHVDFAKKFGDNLGGVHAMHSGSEAYLDNAPGWMKAGLQANLNDVGRQAAATTLGMAGLLGLDGRPATATEGLRGRRGVVPDNVGTSIPDSLRAGGMGAAPISDFRAMPKAASAVPADDDPFAGMPDGRAAGGFIGASSTKPFSADGRTGMRLASLEPTPGLPGFRPTPAKSGRYLKAQPDFEYAGLSPAGALEPAAPIGPNVPGLDHAGPVSGPMPQTGAVGEWQRSLPQQALDPHLLGPRATLAEQTARLAAPPTTFEPLRQQTVVAPAPPLSAPPEMAAPTIAAPVQDLRAAFPPAPPRPEESLFGSIVGPRAAALLGGAVAGLPGAIAGAVVGGLPGLLGRLDNGPMGPAGMAERFNAGYGMSGIEQGMYGPRGATGLSLSNPGAFAVSRGPGQGWDLTNQLGVRTTYGPGGDIRANRDTMRAWGGLLGSLFGGGTGGLLGDRSEGKKDRDKEKRDRWSGEPKGLY